jgi:hypothetical protein
VRIGLAPDGTAGLGSAGVNLTPGAMLSGYEILRGENVRVQRGNLERRPGAKRLVVLTNNTASRTFGTDAKYATFAWPTIPVGGFGVLLHFTATRPAAGKTAFIVGARPAGVAWHIFKVSLDENGVATIEWRSSGGVTTTITTAALSNSNPTHLLVVYDATLGTFTAYVNGDVSGTPATGLAAALKPDTSAATATFGVEKETGAAVTADSHFDGPLDAVTIFLFRGLRIASGDPSMLSTLRTHSLRQWPNPALSYVLAHYDLDEASGTVMYDRSRAKNHGAYVGTPSITGSVALAFPVGNFVGVFQKATGPRINLVAAGGTLYYETVRGGS